ncbi:HD family phosphohydrolase [Clostridium sp. SYSU_GA19001]|uniref:HD family phosphohydrolase n=1 Tax=Clostridium caldaquaticum TaxID=2940653 RepID=UPI002076EAB6|nr:HD family phosphohydrolase [Clostridium caldaquaticum]MCM8711584.1 HD family phosphohydrolase [Clostridium caldaquaticum]
MIKLIKSKLKLKADSASEQEYKECICDLIQHDMVKSMKNFIQHGDINCLEHSLYVSYISFMICRKLRLDYRSAARGGLLHDFFLYDWHIGKPYKGLHGFIHPYIALQNANKYFNLNNREKDIIHKHMWPLTFRLPRYKEAFVVLMVDKYCASIEIIKLGSIRTVHKLKNILEI